MEQIRRHPIWRLPDTEFIRIIKNSYLYKEIRSKFYFVIRDENNDIINERINELNIDITHFNKKKNL
jgi:hypothetical protein